MLTRRKQLVAPECCIAVFLLLSCVQALPADSVSSHDASGQLRFGSSAGSVLSPNLKVVQVKFRNGKLQHDIWSPNSEELIQLNNLIAVPEDPTNYEGEIVEKEGKQDTDRSRSDYVYLRPEVNFDYLNSSTVEETQAVVDIAIVCDKKFGDRFNHDRQKILEYWTKYMWEVNMDFKTLPSTYISIRVTSVVIISTTAGQPYIEESRGPDGKVSYNRMISPFGYFMYEQMELLPPFAVAMGVTDEPAEWYGGLAVLGAACKTVSSDRKFIGNLVMNDGGSLNSMYIAAHEIAHVLGAPHDHEMEGCNARGYIMSGTNHFFSPCSDLTINNYVRSDAGACLREDSNHAPPVLDPDYNSFPVPESLEQCQRHWSNNGWDGDKAFIEPDALTPCWQVPCKIWNGSILYSVKLDALSNAPCGNDGHCFRRRCIQPGNLLTNAASGKCMVSSNRFAYNDVVEMIDCPTRKSSTPLDRFVFNSTARTVATPYSIQEDSVIENDDKCLAIVQEDQGNRILKFDRCSSQAVKNSSWAFLDATLEGEEKILLDGMTQQCVKQEGNEIKLDKCDQNNASFLWILN